MLKKCILIITILFTVVSYGQKRKVLKGDYKNLATITEYNLEFDYSDLSIPKYKNEEAFLKDKMKKREDKEKGAGEKFKKSWFADREDRYEPKFIESFNKRFEEGEIKVGNDLSSAKYTMKIHTTMMWAGYNVGVMRRNAKLEAVIYIYETEKPKNILLKVKYTKVEGNGAFGMDYNSGYRISEAYAKLAKSFAKDIMKRALK